MNNFSGPRHLNVRGKDISLTKKDCIIMSIYKFILKILKILGPHELKGHGHF